MTDEERVRALIEDYRGPVLSRRSVLAADVLALEAILRDALRYRWLRDEGNASWTALADRMVPRLDPTANAREAAAALAQLTAEHDRSTTLHATAVKRAERAEAERDALRALLADLRVTMNHAKVFIGSREKMHPVGQTLYQADIARIDAALAKGKG